MNMLTTRMCVAACFATHVMTFTACAVDVLAAQSSADASSGQQDQPKAVSADLDQAEIVRVLVIGDSISIQGYTKYAAATLKGEMLLYHHTGNAETTRNGLAKLDAWLAEAGGNWDIIHFNWGLWDLRSQGTNVPLAEYTANMGETRCSLETGEGQIDFRDNNTRPAEKRIQTPRLRCSGLQ